MNTLKNFIKTNLGNSNLFDTCFKEDKDIILNTFLT